jgi:hypothetical protein
MDFAFAKMCLSGDHLGIVRTLRARGLKGSQALAGAAEAIKEAVDLIMGNMEMARLLAPAKCCIFCVGCCGRREGLVSAPFKDGKFMGVNCDRFMTPEVFMESIPENGMTFLVSKVCMFKVEIDGGLMAISSTRNTHRNGSGIDWTSTTMTSSRSFSRRRVVAVDKNALAEHVARRLMRSVSAISDTVQGGARLLVNGIPAIKGEGYLRYIDRAMDGTRKERLSKTATIDRLKAGDLDAKIRELVVKAGASAVLDGTYDGNIDAFCSDFYPGMGKWDIVKEMEGV